MQMWQPPAAPERGARRLKTFYPTRMQQGGCDVRVHLLDMSASGVLAHSASVPAVGVVTMLTLGDTPRAAKVMWTDGSRFGLAFVIPFSQAQFADLIVHMGVEG